MTNTIKVFENEEFGQVRTLTEGDKILFCATDIAKALGYTNPHDAILRHCRALVKREVIDVLNRKQEINFIPEGDVYRLIAHSKLPAAEKFESWVFDEVLPSIRKHGAYMTPETIEDVLLNPDTIIKLATSLKEEREKRQMLELENAEMKPKADYADAVQDTANSINIGNLAKLLCNKHNVKIGRNKLFEWLTSHGIIKKVGKRYEPYQKYMDMGLFTVKQNVIQLKDGKTITTQTVQVTGKGQVYLANKIAQDFRVDKKETKE